VSAAPPVGPAPVPLRCPRCGATVAPEQDWCLECGAPARTRLAPTPNWRLPVAIVAAIALAACAALAIAFASLTHDDGTLAPSTTQVAPAQPNETPTTSVPAAGAPAATTPAAGGPAAGATAPGTTAPGTTVPGTTAPGAVTATP
jgi:hypothetical protein